jgi:hypothetical protein
MSRMNGDGEDSPVVPELSCNLNASNRQNVGRQVWESARLQTFSKRLKGNMNRRERTREPRGSPSRETPVAGQSSWATRERTEGSKNFASLKTVGCIWGGEKVQYYQWADRGESFSSKLCTAAREVSDWDEAVVKLKRLIHRRT